MNASTPPVPAASSPLRLRPSVSFAPLDDGILFKNWDRTFTIKGHRSLYALFERLLPHLERGFTRDALLAALPENARGVIALLLDRLAEHDMCVAVEGGGRDEAEIQAFAQALAYLESVAAAPHAAFARIRAARVAVLGRGIAQYTAIRALVTMGLGHLECFTASGDAPAVAACLASQPLVTGTVESDAPGAWHERLLAGAVDLVVHLQDGGDAEAWQAVERVAAACKAPLLQGLIEQNIGLAGPLQVAGGCGLPDTLARHRQVRHPGEPSQAAPAGPGSAGVAPVVMAPVVAALLGNAVAFEVFKHLAGLATATAEGKAIRITGEALAIEHHPVLQVAGQGTGNESAAPDLARLASALAELRSVTAPVEQADRVTRLRDIADDRLGVLELPHPGELPQVPLFTCRARVPGVPGEVFGHADTPTEAYLVAGSAGLCRLAAAGAAAELATITLDGKQTRNMATDALCLVAGSSYDEWLGAGLGQCVVRTMQAGAVPAHGPGAVVSRPVDSAGLTSTTALRWKTLALRFGRDVTATHSIVPGVPGVHVVTIDVDGAQAGLGVAFSRAIAIDEALREAVARVMLAESGVDLPARAALAASPASGHALARDELWQQSGSLAGVERALAALGLVIVVHPFLAVPALPRLGFLIGWVGLDAA